MQSNRRGGKWLGWILVGVMAVLNLAAYWFSWYRWFWFDEVIHAFSLFSITLLVGMYLYGRALTGGRDHRALLVLVVMCVGIAVGVIWEWAEVAFDHFSGPENIIKGKFDTQLDLAMDAVGALLAGLLMLRYVGRDSEAAAR